MNEEPKLFDLEDETPQPSGPVTCLGITFNNDEERREYFRNELRKKLPELKLIEGFPIGEDEDIINLSDPPYYTACPNPWINSFIKEWEADKARLEAEGKRVPGFEVNEPYASDVSEGKNNPIYMAHAYHTKVPHPAIMRYILHYTQPGDIVFDGFAGTGMTGVAAQMCGSAEEVNKLNEKDVRVGVRHAVCSDLAPIATLIAATYNLKFDAKEFKRKAEAILDQVNKELGHLYKTKVNGKEATINYVIWSDVFSCPSCGGEINLWNESVDLEKETMADEFPCPHCGATCSKKNMNKVWETSFDSVLDETVNMVKKVPVRVNYTLNRRRGEKDADAEDIVLAISTEIPSFIQCSSMRMPEGDESRRNDRIGITHIHQFYTHRNFLFLSRMLELAKGDLFLTNWITSVMQRTTKCYKFTLDRKFGILAGTLYIPSLDVELSPVNILTRKVKDFQAVNYPERGKTIISLNSATNVENLPDESIDYIFTDPPFGANINYSELSSIWEGWLKVQTNSKNEAIMNKSQNKGLFEYQSLMNASFKEYYRVLKPGKWLTIEFSNTSASVWNSIQNALQGVGFIVVNVAALDKKQGSFKAVTTTTAVKQDLVITCYKPTDELTQKFAHSSDTAKNAWDFTEELLEHLPVHLMKDNSTTAVVERSPKILFDRLIAYYVQHGYPVPMDAADFQAGLKERFVERDGMYFTAEQALEYEDKKREAPKFVGLALLVGSEAEGIEWLKRKLEEKPLTYQEIQPGWMQDLVTPKKGDSLPELKTILEDNFLEDEGGFWHVPDVNNQAELDAVRNKRLIKEFEVLSQMKKIKTARLEALRAGFKNCYQNKDFATIVSVGGRIPESLLTEDEVLLRYYNIASRKV